LREEIRTSPRAKAMIAGRDKRFVRRHMLCELARAHWTLAMLAGDCYPMGDDVAALDARSGARSWLEQLPSTWVRIEERRAKHRSAEGVPIIQGAIRRCASQQGNALYSITRWLRMKQQTAGRAADAWQWPDGGWNCESQPSAHVRRSTNRCCRCWGSLHMRNDAERSDAAPRGRLKASEIFLCAAAVKSRTGERLISPHGAAKVSALN